MPTKEEPEGPSVDEIQARLAAIVDSSDDAIVSKTLDGIITSWNPAAEKIFGYSAAEAIGQPILLIIPESRRDEETHVLNRIRAGERVDHFETVRRAKDGRPVYVSLTVSPIKNAQGKVIGASKVARDIGVRRGADEARARLAAIVDSSDDAIVSKTLDGIITSWNAAAERMFGYSAAEAIGRSILLIIPADRHGEETRVISEIRSGRKVDHFETQRRTRDGRLIDVSLTVSPIRNSEGEVVGASKVARDVSGRKMAEEERRRLLERERQARLQAERAVQAKDEFLATVSHELRSPLNAILGWAQILRNGASDVVMQRRAVDTITRNAQAQGQLISDILDMQRLASGKLRLNMQQVDLSLAIEAACDTVRPAALAKGVVLSPILDDTPDIPGDPDRIQQVVWNLLSNAVKFSPREGMVVIYLRNLESHVEIQVEDHGPGIKEQFLPYVFERFQQDVAGREKGGMGLGLAIVRHLVELHGGTATATNRVGETGAVVSIRLPKWALAPAPVVVPRLDLERAGTNEEAPPSLHGLTVLLVDDEADAREVVATALELCGANVVVATSAAEAVTLLGASRPHVLVCDISMPGRDGYDLLGEVRDLSDAEGGSTPAIALTAMTTTDDRLRALRAGFQFHVPKPVSALELASAIASLAPQRKR